MRRGFEAFVLEQLQRLGGLECQGMFGGHGLYRDGTFFGIVFDGRLFFKTDANSRTTYIEAGMQPFRPNAKQTLKSYYEVPPDVIEDPGELVRWAEVAVASQGAGAKRRAQSPRSRPGRKQRRS